MDAEEFFLPIVIGGNFAGLDKVEAENSTARR